ncbi:MAG: hypothetical protein J7513_16165 [Solirubrobacteraceae bacterium]|nr:hypothetical protein [Solirubrobacteraceae bacterium]
MQYLREWTSDEERAKVARQLRNEALVWTKVMIEHSPAAGRADPLAVVRQAFADGVDEQWTGRTLDLVTFGGGSTHTSLRLSCSMLVGPTVRSLLRRPVSGGGAAFSTPLRQAAGNKIVGPDLIVIVGNPGLTVPKQLPKGAANTRFLIGSLGADPGPGLRQLAADSGGTAMCLRDETDARFLSSLVVKAHLALAEAGGGQVAAPSDAVQHFDGGGNHRGYVDAYGGYRDDRNYALGENDSPHGLADIEYRERPTQSHCRCPGGGYADGRYGAGSRYYDEFDD